MKIWIERDGQGSIYGHIKEPHPDPDDPFWRSSGGGFALHVVADEFFRKRLKKDTVAEFELKCIWERA